MEKARDMIGGVVGQLTLLLVLVNGLLIWTAYGVYSTQQTRTADACGASARVRSRNAPVRARRG